MSANFITFSALVFAVVKQFCGFVFWSNNQVIKDKTIWLSKEPRDCSAYEYLGFISTL